jgi:hypothetical protein
MKTNKRRGGTERRIGIIDAVYMKEDYSTPFRALSTVKRARAHWDGFAKGREFRKAR